MNIERIGGYLKSMVSPCPSIFDLSIVGILYTPFLRNDFLRGWYFVFCSIFIMCLTLFLKPKREFKAVHLGLFALWSFAMIFLHNRMEITPNSLINHFFNVSIMSEGFLYIFCGIFLVKNIVTYSTNLRFLILLLPVAFIPIVNYNVYGGRVTIPAAILISMITYLFLNKKNIPAIILSALTGATAVFMFPWIQMKFQCRPILWRELIRQIIEHPIIGTGFNHTLYPDNMVWVRENNYGWLWRHGDFLSIGAYLGISALLLVLWFTVDTLIKMGKSIYLIPILTIVLTSCFQMTMFSPDKAAICLVIIGMCLAEKRRAA
jgi:hypothetical protein